MLSHLFIFYCVCGNLVFGEREFIPTERDNLHHFMDDQELEYYFGPEHKSSMPDYEIINLPSILDNRNTENEFLNRFDDIKLQFQAFGNPIKLKLRPNNKLISPNIKIVKKSENDNTEVLTKGINGIKNCHYLHSDKFSVAALSNCHENEINGILLFANATFEIRPLTERLQSLLKLPEPLLENSQDIHIPHIIKRASILSEFPEDDSIYRNLNPNQFEENKNFFENFNGEPDSVRKYAEGLSSLSEENILAENYLNDNPQYQKRSSKERKLTVEVGVFFDEAGYKIFAPYFNHDVEKIRDMLLAYMNGVQALYHHRSLGTPVDITIVYMEIMKKQPIDMPHFDGERGDLLDSFCDYQKKINPPNDDNPEHWDMALYVSGLDFFAYENGRKSFVTMGLATVGGVCIDKYACIIAEFGTTNLLGRPYPSAGFTSVYIMAHEIGHNLGMHHDSMGNSCPKEGFVMSPSRGTSGETTWSTCSADVIYKLSYAKCLYDKPLHVPEKYNAWKYFGFPGQTWTSKRQCEVLLRDKDAYISVANSLENICTSLQCRTPHRSGFFSSGPALDGTDCGTEKWCYGGVCSKKTKLPKPLVIMKGGWSSWKSDECNSSCVIKSKGIQIKRRSCNNPKPMNTDEGCEGVSIDYVLCDDSKICRRNKRKSVIDYASEQCKYFSTKLLVLDKTGKGLQAPHEVNRLWMGCAIFCKREDSGAYYTPRIELNDLGMDPYFPNGAWCHNDGKQNYYCRQHHCLPETFRLTKFSLLPYSEDLPLSGNAFPYPKKINEKILRYLSVDSKGRPLLTHINPEDLDFINEDEWSDIDYIELPKDILPVENESELSNFIDDTEK